MKKPIKTWTIIVTEAERRWLRAALYSIQIAGVFHDDDRQQAALLEAKLTPKALGKKP